MKALSFHLFLLYAIATCSATMLNIFLKKSLKYLYVQITPIYNSSLCHSRQLWSRYSIYLSIFLKYAKYMFLALRSVHLLYIQ